MIWLPKPKRFLASVMKFNQDGELEPRLPRQKKAVEFPAATKTQEARTLRLLKYFDKCNQLGRLPTREEWDDGEPDGAA